MHKVSVTITREAALTLSMTRNTPERRRWDIFIITRAYKTQVSGQFNPQITFFFLFRGRLYTGGCDCDQTRDRTYSESEFVLEKTVSRMKHQQILLIVKISVLMHVIHFSSLMVKY